jgi:uncharacterized protein (TIGR03905 family)
MKGSGKTMFTYYPKGVCSTRYDFDIQDGVIRHVAIQNGCRGNLTGISRLLEGMTVQDAIERMQGVICRNGTSCPDQMAKALSAYLSQEGDGQ